MQKISFKKDKLIFVFRNPMYSLGELTLEYKILNILENSTNDGFFYRATYNENSKTINLNIRVIVNKKEYLYVKYLKGFKS